MTFYDEMQGIATGLLTEFNQGSIFYIQVTPGNGPADDPGAASETTFALAAVAKGVSFKYVQKGLAVATDLQATFAVRSDMTLAENGFILADGVRYKIVQIINIPPTGVTVAHRVIFRK